MGISQLPSLPESVKELNPYSSRGQAPSLLSSAPFTTLCLVGPPAAGSQLEGAGCRSAGPRNLDPFFNSALLKAGSSSDSPLFPCTPTLHPPPHLTARKPPDLKLSALQGLRIPFPKTCC